MLSVDNAMLSIDKFPDSRLSRNKYELLSYLEQFSHECRKTKTKVITFTNNNKNKTHTHKSKRMEHLPLRCLLLFPNFPFVIPPARLLLLLLLLFFFVYLKWVETLLSRP